MFTDRVYLNDILYRIVLYDIVSYYFAICLYYIIQWDIIFYANNLIFDFFLCCCAHLEFIDVDIIISFLSSSFRSVFFLFLFN